MTKLLDDWSKLKSGGGGSEGQEGSRATTTAAEAAAAIRTLTTPLKTSTPKGTSIHYLLMAYTEGPLAIAYFFKVLL